MTNAMTNYEVEVMDIFEDNWGNLQMEMVWRGGIEQLVEANDEMELEDFENLKNRGDEVQVGGGGMAGFIVRRLTRGDGPARDPFDTRGKIVDISNLW